MHENTVDRLYKRIDIHLWAREDTRRFIQCNELSAEKYLKHVRELVVFDEQITEDIATTHNDPIALPAVKRQKTEVASPDLRSGDLADILRMIPGENLQRFRYV
jgi:hypothetical protein